MRKMFVLLMLFVLVSVSCQGAEEVSEETVVGVVLVGPSADRGWSQAHAEGIAYAVEKVPNSRAIVFELLNPADSQKPP